MNFIIARDGTKITYHVTGKGNPLFIFNGFTCSAPNLKLLVSILSKKYQVIFWDYKGHGQSGTPKDFNDVTIEGSVDDANRVLEKLKIKKAIFLGYSTGVQIMLAYNFRYPGTAKCLISIAGFSDKVLDSFLKLDTKVFGHLVSALKNISPHVPNVLSSVWKWVHKLPFDLRLFVASKTFLNAEKPMREDIMPFLDSMQEQDLNLLIHFILDVHNHPLSKPLETIELPTLILAGEKDLFAPVSRSEEMHHKIKGSEILVIPKASHNVIQEEAELLSKTILNFLSKNKH